MYVIKRSGRKERFSEGKVVKSAYDACLSSGMDVKESIRISQHVLSEIKKTFGNKREIKSNVIFGKMKKLLAKQNKECAFMYETHRDIS